MFLIITTMKDHGPEWKYVAIVEEKEKGNPKVQYKML